MLVVTRHRVTADAEAFLAEAETALAALAGRAGYVTGAIGRAADDPELWVLTSRWVHVGAYRRALSAYEVKLHAVPLLSTAVDEPTAFEVLVDVAGGVLLESEPRGRSDRAADAASIGLGGASGPDVPSDLPGGVGRRGPTVGRHEPEGDAGG